MSIRDILVAVEDGAAGEQRVEAAMGWARALDAHLTGLYAIPRVIPAATSNHTGRALGNQAESFEMERRLKRRRQENRTRALECERRFLGIAEQSEVDASWALARVRRCPRRRW